MSDFDNSATPRRLHNTNAPWWFVALIILGIAPLGSTPAMVSYCPPDSSMLRTFIWCYPVAIVASAFYAWVSYRPRPLLAWIMLIFMFLIDASMIYIVFFVPPFPAGVQ